MPWCQLANRPLCHVVNIGYHASQLIGHVPQKFVSVDKISVGEATDFKAMFLETEFIL